jgi:hypothetical protein
MAAADDLVSVVPAPNEGRPGDSITVTFAANSPGWVIDTCSAGFAGGASVVCAAPATVVTVTVPETAEPGSIMLGWGASYHQGISATVPPLETATGSESGNADGSIPFTVLPPEPSISPSADPVTPGRSAGPDGGVAGTTASPAGGSSVPPQPVPTSGASASEHQGAPLIAGVLGLVLLAGLATAVLVRRSRARPAAQAGGPPGAHVRAVPHPGPVRVTVRTTRAGVTVRLESHAGHPAVHVQEV